jgi:hypothetical protein
MPKKKVFAARNLKDYIHTKFTTHKRKSKKRNSKFFIKDNFVLP